MLTARSLKQLKEELIHGQYKSMRDLAKKYKVHEMTIYRYNKELGLTRKKLNEKAILEDIKLNLYTQAQIAERHNISIRTVYNVKRRNPYISNIFSIDNALNLNNEKRGETKL